MMKTLHHNTSCMQMQMYGWAMSQKRPVNGFEQVKKLSKFDGRFVKNYAKNSDKEYFLEVDFEHPKNLHNLHSDLSFLSERKKMEKCNNVLTFMIRRTMLFT